MLRCHNMRLHIVAMTSLRVPSLRERSSKDQQRSQSERRKNVQHALEANALREMGGLWSSAEQYCSLNADIAYLSGETDASVSQGSNVHKQTRCCGARCITILDSRRAGCFGPQTLSVVAHDVEVARATT